MIQQSSAPCESCRGQGLSGIVSREEEAAVQVTVPPYCRDGTRLRFAQQGNEAYNVHDSGSDRIIASDVIVQIVYQTHPFYTVLGDSDLYAQLSISIRDACQGFTVALPPLKPADEGQRIVSISPLQSSRGGLRIPNLGFKTGGDLFLDFDVRFPTSLQYGGGTGTCTAASISLLDSIHENTLLPEIQGLRFLSFTHDNTTCHDSVPVPEREMLLKKSNPHHRTTTTAPPPHEQTQEQDFFFSPFQSGASMPPPHGCPTQ